MEASKHLILFPLFFPCLVYSASCIHLSPIIMVSLFCLLYFLFLVWSQVAMVSLSPDLHLKESELHYKCAVKITAIQYGREVQYKCAVKNQGDNVNSDVCSIRTFSDDEKNVNRSHISIGTICIHFFKIPLRSE